MHPCKICAKTTQPILDFGKMPIANGFVTNLNGKEFFFHLSVGLCPACFMVQLEETVPPEKMFHENYQFLSSTSQAMMSHFEGNAKEIMERLSGKKKAFVVELGCNDGVMLQHIAKKKIAHLGVEPSANVAKLAAAKGVNTRADFFNAKTAREIVREMGQADIICGSNVFCHIEDLNSVFTGINILLKDDGVLFFEDPYLLDIMKKSSFDQIYDEHVYYFCGLSVSELAKRHNLQLVDMAPQEVHGGSMRYYLKKGFSNQVTEKVEQFLKEEKSAGLDNPQKYGVFQQKIDGICSSLKKTLVQMKAKENRIVGYGATSKSTTLFNYAQIGPELIDYICDTTPNKINKFTPGTHIPIKPYEDFLKDKVSYVLLLAWNHKKEILEKEKTYRNRGGKFITYFPEVKVE